jgi:hypothetical protein
MHRSAKLVGIAVLLLGTAALAEAVPIPAVSLSNMSGRGLINPPFTLGWGFETSQSIVVFDLGLFDSEQDGLSQSHEIGLWDESGTLLVSTTIVAGTSGNLEGNFRFVNVAPVALAPGVYVIGALYPDLSLDPLVFPGGATSFATGPGIEFLSPLFADGATLLVPNFAVGDATMPSYFGPNFRYEAGAVVPEPGSLLLIGGGLLGLGAAGRRRVGKSSTVRDPYERPESVLERTSSASGSRPKV